MDGVNYYYALGCHVYEFNVVCNKQTIPYQLSLEEDIAEERFNVVLLNLMAKDNETIVQELKTIVCECIIHFFNMFPKAILYFDIDVAYKRNYIKFVKFFRWASNHQSYNFIIDSTQKNLIKYLEVTITKKL